MRSMNLIGAITIFIIAVFFAPAFAGGGPPPPKYDATGTWEFKFTEGWTDCDPEQPADETHTVSIVQAGDTFSFNSGDIESQTGSIKGSRYQLVFAAEAAGGGSVAQSIVWDLESFVVGNGYATMIQLNQGKSCNITGDIHLEKQGVCNPSDTRMCLQNGRFSVIVEWEDEHGSIGVGHAVPSTDDSGLFWFFSPNNMELLIKVLNGCSYNNRYWVFFAATTDQAFSIRVTDLATSESVVYDNPLKNPADAVTDTDAFATCTLP